MADFSRFESRFQITGQLVLDTPVRIGASRSYDAIDTDLPVLKDALGNPVIPGSSMKGVLRAYVESILRTLQEEVGYVQHVNIQDESIRQQIEKDEESTEWFTGRQKVLATEPMTELQKEWIDPSTLNIGVVQELLRHWRRMGFQRKDSGAFDQFLIDCSSLAQTIFGAPWVAAKVHIQDAAAITEFPIRTLIRDGVAINRDRRVAQDKALYTFEAVPAGTRFQFRLVIENGTNDEIAVTVMGIKALSRGELRIGGGTSRGLGIVHLENVAYSLVNRANLLQFLIDGHAETIQEAQIEQVYRDFLNQFIGGEDVQAGAQ